MAKPIVSAMDQERAARTGQQAYYNDPENVKKRSDVAYAAKVAASMVPVPVAGQAPVSGQVPANAQMSKERLLLQGLNSGPTREANVEAAQKAGILPAVAAAYNKTVPYQTGSAPNQQIQFQMDPRTGTITRNVLDSRTGQPYRAALLPGEEGKVSYESSGLPRGSVGIKPREGKYVVEFWDGVERGVKQPDFKTQEEAVKYYQDKAASEASKVVPATPTAPAVAAPSVAPAPVVAPETEKLRKDVSEAIRLNDPKKLEEIRSNFQRDKIEKAQSELDSREAALKKPKSIRSPEASVAEYRAYQDEKRKINDAQKDLEARKKNLLTPSKPDASNGSIGFDPVAGAVGAGAAVPLAMLGGFSADSLGSGLRTLLKPTNLRAIPGVTQGGSVSASVPLRNATRLLSNPAVAGLGAIYTADQLLGKVGQKMGVEYADGSSMPATAAIYSAATGKDLTASGSNQAATPESAKLQAASSARARLAEAISSGSATSAQKLAYQKLDSEIEKRKAALIAAMKPSS